MSVVILGGNECMERRYKELCQAYRCQAKVVTKTSGGLKNKLGSPDLMIFFTNTMSHKLVQGALSEMKGNATDIEIHAMQLEKIKAKLNRIISEATGKPLEKVAHDTDRDHWLDADDAVQYGLISRIVTKRSVL